MTVNARLFGDWAGASRRLKQLPDHVITELNMIVKEQAYLLLEKIKSAVESQTLRLDPLSDAYLSRKISEGLDERVLIATGEYIDNLRVLEKGKGRDYKVFVGAIRGDKHESSGLDMAKLAKYLDDGTPRIPARPHISVVWKNNRDNIRRTIASSLAKELASRGL